MATSIEDKQKIVNLESEVEFLKREMTALQEQVRSMPSPASNRQKISLPNAATEKRPIL